MNIPSFFINRPVATSLLAIAVTLSGLLAYFHLPVAPLPNITLPVIVGPGDHGGRGPDIMASTVAEPLERRLATIAGVNELTSTNCVGSSQIVVQFAINRDIDGAARDVQAAIQAARADLPTTLRGNPSYRKFNPADSPIIILSLTSSTLTTAQLYDCADTVLQQQLSQITGVGQISSAAAPCRRSASSSSRTSSRATASASRTCGRRYPPPTRTAPRAISTRATSASKCCPTIRPPWRPTIRIWSSPSAKARRSCCTMCAGGRFQREYPQFGLYNDKPAVGVIVYPIPGANIVETDAQIRKVLPSIEATLPHNINLHIAMDRSQSVNAAVDDTERTLTIAVMLVIAVVFVFLQSLRSMLIPAVALPLSIIGTFGPMYLLGYSIDNLSLMSLTIGTGFVVDDAVVVLENIVRHLDSGKGRREAALRGSAEVELHGDFDEPVADRGVHPDPVDAGHRRAVFHEFAVTLSIAILFSMVISLTITPRMCAHLLNARRTLHSRPRWAVWTEASSSGSRTPIRAGCMSCSIARCWSGVLLIGMIVRNVFLFDAVRHVLSRAGHGHLIGQIIADQAISFPAMSNKLAQLQRSCRRIPAVASVFGFAGSRRACNTANVYIELKPLSQRELSRRRDRPAPASQAQRHLRRAAVPAGAAGSAHRRQAIGGGISIYPERRRCRGTLQAGPRG